MIGKLKEADLILAIGSRLGDAVTQGYTLLDMAGSVPIIQVLPDGGEIGRVFRVALGIVSDLNTFAIAAAGLDPVKPAWTQMDAGAAVAAGSATRGSQLPGPVEPRHGHAGT